MTSKETFTHYQPLGNGDPAHTATAPELVRKRLQ